MYVVMYKAKNALNCEAWVLGPYTYYMDAEEVLTKLPVAADCDWKYIKQMLSLDEFLYVEKKRKEDSSFDE